MTQRTSRDEALMETAETWSHRGTCGRLRVGAVFSIEGRILVQGYNGAPAGMDHCVHEYYSVDSQTVPPPWVVKRVQIGGKDKLPATGDYFYLDNGIITWKTGSDAQLHDGCQRAMHAEANGIAFAARKGVKLEGCELHVTDSPCFSCAMLVANVGVGRVVFKRPYRKNDGVELLASAGVEVVDFSSLIA